MLVSFHKPIFPISKTFFQCSVSCFSLRRGQCFIKDHSRTVRAHFFLDLTERLPYHHGSATADPADFITWASAETRCGGCRPAARDPPHVRTRRKRGPRRTVPPAHPRSSSAKGSGSQLPPARPEERRSSC